MAKLKKAEKKKAREEEKLKSRSTVGKPRGDLPFRYKTEREMPKLTNRVDKLQTNLAKLVEGIEHSSTLDAKKA